MAYVINVPNHELPYREILTRIFKAFHVPLNYKKGKDPKRYDYFEETFLTICQPKRENGVWWLSTVEHRRRDDEAEEVHSDAPAANEDVNQEDFNWEAVNDEDEIQGQEVEKEREIQEGSGSDDKFNDAEFKVEALVDEV
ncbi:hypothetical protein Dimus_013475 [Dionaea muscipula]